jgi:Tol biopolymer transport system component
MKKFLAAVVLLALATGAAYAGSGGIAYSKQAGEKTYIFLANADGTNARQTAAAEYGGRLSPDGSRIVYSASGNAFGKSGEYVWIYDTATQKTLPLKIAGERHLGPVWSPDGTKLLFSTLSNGWRPAVYELKTAKLTVFSTSAAKGLLNPFWSADGRYVYAIDPFTKLFKFTTGGKLVQSLPASSLLKGFAGAVCEPGGDISADGGKLLFRAGLSKEKCFVGAKQEDGNPTKYAVFSYDFGSGKITRVTPKDYCTYEAVWAADGSVLFSAHKATAGSDGVENIYRLALGGKPELLVKGAGGVSSSR